MGQFDPDFRTQRPTRSPSPGHRPGEPGESILVCRPNGPTVRRENRWPVGPSTVGQWRFPFPRALPWAGRTAAGVGAADATKSGHGGKGRKWSTMVRPWGVRGPGQTLSPLRGARRTAKKRTRPARIPWRASQEKNSPGRHPLPAGRESRLATNPGGSRSSRDDSRFSRSQATSCFLPQRPWPPEP